MPSSGEETSLVRAEGIAPSLEEARPGQLMLIDAKGDLSKRPVLLAYGSCAVAGVASVGLTLGLGLLIGPLAGLTVVWGGLLTAYAMLGGTRDLGHATRAIGRGNLALAERHAKAAARRRVSLTSTRGNAFMMAGAACWLQGKHREGLELTQQALRVLPATGWTAALHVLCRLHEVQLLALLGELRAAQDHLDALEHEGLPNGELVRMQHLDTRLVLAFETDTIAALPDDLSEWNRWVLNTNRFGSTLVLLAWAHVEQSQLDMVPILLDVAADRLPECHIDTAHPKLARWYGEARQRFSSGDEGDLLPRTGD